MTAVWFTDLSRGAGLTSQIQFRSNGARFALPVSSVHEQSNGNRKCGPHRAGRNTGYRVRVFTRRSAIMARSSLACDRRATADPAPLSRHRAEQYPGRANTRNLMRSISCPGPPPRPTHEHAAPSSMSVSGPELPHRGRQVCRSPLPEYAAL